MAPRKGSSPLLSNQAALSSGWDSINPFYLASSSHRGEGRKRRFVSPKAGSGVGSSGVGFQRGFPTARVDGQEDLEKAVPAKTEEQISERNLQNKSLNPTPLVGRLRRRRRDKKGRRSSEVSGSPFTTWMMPQCSIKEIEGRRRSNMIRNS